MALTRPVQWRIAFSRFSAALLNELHNQQLTAVV
jgi:hypothetical protein